MSVSSIRKFISSKISQESSTTKSKTAEREATPGKSSFLGAFAGLRSRGGAKIHPEPMPQQPRTRLQSHSRRDATPLAHAPSAFSTQARREGQPAPTRRPPEPPQRQQSAFNGKLHQAPPPPAPARKPPQPSVRQNVPVGVGRTNGPQTAAPAKPPQRAERTETRPNPRPAPAPPLSHADGLRSSLQDLAARMKVLDRRNYELQSAPEGETPEAEDKIERELEAVNQERKKLITIRKSMQVRLDFIEKPAANELVQTLTQLAQVKGPLQTNSSIGSMQGDVIRGNKNALRQQGHLLGKREELISTQRQVRQALEAGAFKGLPAAELKQMRALANLDVDRKLGQVSDLQEMVRQTDRQLKAMGAGGLFDGIQTTAAERARAEEEKRQADQDAWDNGYRS